MSEDTYGNVQFLSKHMTPDQVRAMFNERYSRLNEVVGSMFYCCEHAGTQTSPRSITDPEVFNLVEMSKDIYRTVKEVSEWWTALQDKQKNKSTKPKKKKR